MYPERVYHLYVDITMILCFLLVKKGESFVRLIENNASNKKISELLNRISLIFLFL